MTSKPDWRKPADYPDPADTSLHRWAWEFLQRNPEYVKNPISREWGITMQLRPGGQGGEAFFGDSPTRFDLAPRGLKETKTDVGWIASASVRDDRLVLEFDLDAPIDPQLERARISLVHHQRIAFPALRRQRNQTEKFPLYLRVLDALAAGASRGEMLKEFQRHRADAVDDRTLRYWIKKSTALRDGGYRDLLKQ
jgi:hypothetical protein